MNKIIKILAVFLVSFLFTQFSSNAQIDCPSNTFGWTSDNESYHFGRYGGGGSVDYEYKQIASDDYQVKIDWSSLVNDDDVVSDDVLKKILEREIVKWMDHSQQEGTFQVSVYYITECTATVKLVLELERETELHCCNEGMPVDYYEYIDDQNDFHILYDIKKQITCGYKCCKRVYDCSRVYDDFYDIWRSEINGVSTVSVTNCGGLTDYEDCKTGGNIPCEEGSCE